MNGRHKIIVQNRKVRFSFEIDHNINIIRGNSATGKTTLISMISDHNNDALSSGVQLTCDKNCVALTGLSNNPNRYWKNELKNIKDSIVFIDEGEAYVSSEEFAAFIQNTDNYYVIATRNNLYNLPYSVDAIYEVKYSGKYGKLKRAYNNLKRIYDDRPKTDNTYSMNEVVIVEDGKSGFQFFDKVSKDAGILCTSADGKSNVFNVLQKSLDKSVLIVADGAAFGAEMANIYGLLTGRRITLFLPESFEWLILSSGIIDDHEVFDMLADPSRYIDSEKFFSWEQYFTKYLIALSKGTEYQYSKTKLNSYYTSSKIISKILGVYFQDLK